MSSSYSTTLRTELPANGDQNNAWAPTVDNNLNVPIEQGLTGVITINIPDANVTLTTANAAADQARMAVLVLTGALTDTRTITAPQVPKIYIIRNTTTGGQKIILRTGVTSLTTTAVGYPLQYSAIPYSGSTTGAVLAPGVIIPPNSTVYVYTDGVVFNYCINSLPKNAAADSVTLASPLPLANGGTGSTTTGGARSALGTGSAATVNADTNATAVTVPLRDGFSNFSANVITAGLNGTATNASNTNLLGNLPPPRYSGANTNWVYTNFVSRVANQLEVVDIYGLMGAGPCLVQWIFNGVGGPYFKLQGFFCVPDGSSSASAFSQDAALIGQFFAVPQFGQMLGVFKLSKLP